jgi:hypothetical protein
MLIISIEMSNVRFYLLSSSQNTLKKLDIRTEKPIEPVHSNIKDPPERSTS